MKRFKFQKKWCAAILVFLAVAVFCSTEEAHATPHRIPILMYHDIITDGKANDMMVTQKRFRQDMEFLREEDYTPLTSVDILEIEDGSMKMPSKPVMVTFDDGYESNYSLAYPILRATGMKATISLITSYIGRNPNFLTWEQVRQMYQSGLVDIGCHTNALHKQAGRGMPRNVATGIQRLRGEGWSHYQQRVGADLDTAMTLLHSNVPGLRVLYFSYPFGAVDRWFQTQVEDHYIRVTTTSTQGTASVLDGSYELPRLRVTMNKSVSQMFARDVTAQAQTLAVSVDGAVRRVTGYEIAGDYYISLEDVASLLQGTTDRFDVISETDGKTALLIGKPYYGAGKTILQQQGASAAAHTRTEPFLVDGQDRMLASYMIRNSNYVRLESMAEMAGFRAVQDIGCHTVTITTQKKS